MHDMLVYTFIICHDYITLLVLSAVEKIVATYYIYPLKLGSYKWLHGFNYSPDKAAHKATCLKIHL